MLVMTRLVVGIIVVGVMLGGVLVWARGGRLSCSGRRSLSSSRMSSRSGGGGGASRRLILLVLLLLLVQVLVLVLVLLPLLVALSSRRAGWGGDAHGRPVRGRKGCVGGATVVAVARTCSRDTGPRRRTDLCMH